MKLMLAIMTVLSMSLWSAPSMAQDYPTKTARLIVGMAPGGANDTFARLIGEKLTERLGQQFVVENHTGANSTIATDMLSKAPADGYTLMLVINSHVTNGILYKSLTYDPLKDFVPVSLIARTPFVLLAHPSLPVASLSELIELSKTRRVTFGSPGLGSVQHLACELLNSMSGSKLVNIPYNSGAAAVTDLLGGHVDVGFVTTTAGLPLVESGKVKALAVSTSTRSDGAPDVPTIAEAGVPGYHADVWFGIIAPAGTPEEVVDKLNQEIRAITKLPDVQERIKGFDAQVIDASPEEFGQIMKAEHDQWSKLINELGISLQQ